MKSLPCVNTIELNRYLKGQEDAEARDEYIADKAYDIQQEILSDEDGRDLVAELMIESDELDDVKLIIEIIKQDLSDSEFKKSDIFPDDDIETIISEGTENSYEEFSIILSRMDKLPIECQCIVEPYEESAAMIIAKKAVEKEEENGPDYDGPDFDEM